MKRLAALRHTNYKSGYSHTRRIAEHQESVLRLALKTNGILELAHENFLYT